jgi:hypothetical protein
MPYLIKLLIKKMIKSCGREVAVNESERKRPRKFGGKNVRNQFIDFNSNTKRERFLYSQCKQKQ